MTTKWWSDVNTKEGKKHFKVALKERLKQSEMKGNFRQDTLILSDLLCKRGRQWPSKAYELCLVIKKVPELIWLLWAVGWVAVFGGPQWQLILGHASVVSAGTDSGQTPVRKCLEVLTSALSKLSTAKMEKTISLRWEHGEPECKSPLGSVSANTLPQSSHAPVCSLTPVRMVQQSLLLGAHVFPPSCGPLMCKKLI